MTALPAKNVLDGSKIPAPLTEDMKAAQGQVWDFLAGLFGSAGTVAVAWKTLSAGGDVTLGDNAGLNVNLKAGVAGTIGAINWTFNTTSTSYGSISLPYDTRTTVGLKIESAAYPITQNSGNGHFFQEDGVTHTTLDTGGNLLQKQAAPAAVNTTSTLATSAILGRIITSAPAGAVSLTLPTGTSMDSALAQMAVDQAVDWTVINTNGTNASTIVANTGHTVVGNMAVAPNVSAVFRSRKTAANTFVTYRVS